MHKKLADDMNRTYYFLCMYVYMYVYPVILGVCLTKIWNNHLVNKKELLGGNYLLDNQARANVMSSKETVMKAVSNYLVRFLQIVLYHCKTVHVIISNWYQRWSHYSK